MITGKNTNLKNEEIIKMLNRKELHDFSTYKNVRDDGYEAALNLKNVSNGSTDKKN